MRVWCHVLKVYCTPECNACYESSAKPSVPDPTGHLVKRVAILTGHVWAAKRALDESQSRSPHVQDALQELDAALSPERSQDIPA